MNRIVKPGNPLGVTHRLDNPGKTSLDMIGMQSGGHLGEDDIVRFDDQDGRDQESGHAGAGTSH